MSDVRKCPDCGTALRRDAPEGICPVCTFAGALRLSVTSSPEHPAPVAPNAAAAEEGGPSLCLGDYELIEEIARGGMGVVYRARQRSLDRIVAVKLILFGPFADEGTVRRFRAEAAAAAKLHHPNIVAIHEVGEQDGRYFFSMDYIQGQNLADFAGEHALPAGQGARLIQTIAEAIQYAHDQGIVHRDLKPSNILIDRVSEPHVTDFGLAKRFASSTEHSASGIQDLTLSGQVLGSPNFMPPEQAVGRRGQVGPRSDIYSLGAILYYLLTGRPPFMAETHSATLYRLAYTDPVPPHLVNPRVPRDLETVCLKCLEKEPSRRYGTAQELAAELGRFMGGEPVHARRAGLVTKSWRWCRRKPGITSLAVSLLVALILGLAGVLWQWQRAEDQSERAEALTNQMELQRVADLLSANEASAALDQVGQLLRRDPKGLTLARLTRLLLAATNIPAGQKEMVDYYSWRAVKLSPELPEAWWARAEVLQQRGDPNAALAAMRAGGDRQPKDPHFWIAWGDMLVTNQQLEKALSAYSRAIDLTGPTAGQPASIYNNALLRRREVLLRLNRPGEAQPDFLLAKRIPSRDPQTPTNCLDLSPYYNAALDEDWHGKLWKGNNLATLPRGKQTFAGVDFDVRGLIQLGSPRIDGFAPGFPRQVTGITIRQRWRILHFLHAAAWGNFVSNGVQIGSYRLHYADGSKEEIALRNGVHLCEWQTRGTSDLARAAAAWTGKSQIGASVRLFRMSWQNPSPAVQIDRIDFVSQMTDAAPFLIAITGDNDSMADLGHLIQQNSVSSLMEAIQLAPTNGLVLARLARRLLQQGAGSNAPPSAAILTYSSRALEFAPEEPEAWWTKAELLQQAGDTNGALAAMRRGGEYQSQNLDFWMAWIHLLEINQQIEEALRTCSKALELAELVGSQSTAARQEVLLSRRRLLLRMGRNAEAQADLLVAKKIPKRDPQTSTNCVDLSPHYNAALHENWHSPPPATGWNLRLLPAGRQTLGGVQFDVRGLIQLHGKGLASVSVMQYPDKVDGLLIRRRARHLHFLHANVWGKKLATGTAIGRYLVQYTDGKTAEIPIIHGEDLLEWQILEDVTAELKSATTAWTGKAPSGAKVRLFKRTWANPRGEIEIHSIDFRSAMTLSAPFLVAITVDP